MRPETFENLVFRNGPVSDLHQFYRGWAGLGSSFEQIAEGEVYASEGWWWTVHPKKSEVCEPNGDRAEVCIEYQKRGHPRRLRDYSGGYRQRCDTREFWDRAIAGSPAVPR